MKFIDDIRVSLTKRKLKKLLPQRDSRFFNLSKIKSMNILYYLNQPLNIEAKDQYKQIYAMLDDLRDRGIKCELTFFVQDSFVETKRVNMTALIKENFSYWTYSPDEQTYNNFMMDDAQVLINLSPAICWPLEHFAQSSKASLKIAVQREEQGARYDFLFKPADDTTYPLGVYQQIINYLEMINK